MKKITKREKTRAVSVIQRIAVCIMILSVMFTMGGGSLIVNATEVPSVETGTGADENGFVVDNTGALVSYVGVGGDITIPSNVTSIGANVFAGNTTLTTVTVPANVAIFGTGIFSNCTSLTSVTIQGNISSIPAQTFYNCQNLHSVYVPASVTAIGAEAFASCVSLSGITLPAATATIGERAFYGCSSLAGVALPSTVSAIGTNAFAGCGNLTTYTVDSSNPYYLSYDGCLYNKAGTRLISCPEGKSSVTIAESTRVIAANAFYNCTSLTTLSVPAGVTTIESNAFAGSSIRDVTILSGVTSIGAQNDWSADVIYGENNTTAQTYAESNNIVFESMNSSAGDEPTTETESDPVPEPEPGSQTPTEPETEVTPPAGGTNTGTGTTPQAGADVSGTVQTAPTTASSSGGSASTASTTTTTSHQKDATPKTGDGINPIFFFCAACMVIGISLYMMGKRKEQAE